MALQEDRSWGWEVRWEGVDGWRFKSCWAGGGKGAGERNDRNSLQAQQSFRETSLSLLRPVRVWKRSAMRLGQAERTREGS